MKTRRDPKANQPIAPPRSRDDEKVTRIPQDQPTFGGEGGGGSYRGGPNAQGPSRKPGDKAPRRPDPALS